MGILTSVMDAVKKAVAKLNDKINGINSFAGRTTTTTTTTRAQQPPAQRPSSSSNGPQITIRRWNSNSNGNTMVIGPRRKPTRCPICATKDRIVSNQGVGGNHWRCEACGNTFN